MRQEEFGHVVTIVHICPHLSFVVPHITCFCLLNHEARVGDSSHMTWTESDSHMVETSEELDPKNIDSGLVSKLDAAKGGSQMIF